MTLKPIVVGVDGTIESVHAAALAWRIAQAGGADCRLVHAFPDLWSVTTAPGLELDPGALKPVLEDVRRQIAETLTRAVPPVLREALEVRFGRPGWVLAETAERLNAELVVVGGKHHGSLVRALGGSTAHYLVRTLDIPVLVTAGTDAPGRVSRILVAVDLSDASARTLDAAERWSTALGAQLRVLHVVEALSFPPVLGITIDETDAMRRVETQFEGLVGRLTNVPEYHRVLRQGHAVETIADEAAKWRADVVVVGSHGKGLVDRILIGSGTERLLNLLPASLLIVPIGAARRRPTEAELRRRAKVLA